MRKKLNLERSALVSFLADQNENAFIRDELAFVDELLRSMGR
jgi:hypothetical protein